MDKTIKIIDKIKALLRLAESTHSKAEKEAASATAQKLITEYQISQAQLLEQVGNRPEEDNLEGTILYEAGRVSAWKSELAFGVAELNGTYCLSFSGIRNDTSHRRGSRLRIFGRPTDIELTQYMFEFLVRTIDELSYWHIPNTHKRGVNPERESFSLGCVRGFLDKMRGAKNASLQLASQSAALVLANRTNEIQTKLQEKNNWTIGTKTASKASHNASAYSTGYKKGQNISVNSGIGGNRSSPLKLSQ